MMYRIGIDLGGTNIKVGIVNENYEIIEKHSIKTLVERPYHEIIKDMADAIYYLLEKKNIGLNECLTIGIGSPGTVDAKSGVVLYSNNFGWENIPLVAELKKYINLPVFISNDANCAALGETVAGAAKGADNVILLTLGTGVGGGVILSGKVFEGGHAGGAELGHTVIVDGGEACTCGRKGCFESYASATALIRETKAAALAHKESLLMELCEGDIEKINGKTPFDAAQMGDETAKEVVGRYIWYLANGITNMINIFRPDKVLLSGGVCNQGEKLTKPLSEIVNRTCFGGEKAFIPPIERAMLGNDAGIIGAAALGE
ncbi:MAG: glucokinase [Clostridiales bacterium]|nr:glucokinase [Clostridiales bacterium]